MNGRHVATTAALALLLSVALAPSVARGAWAGPSVISGWKNGPVAIANSAVDQQMAALTLPGGRWVAWAKLYVQNDATGYASVSCTLAGTGNVPGRGTVNVGSAGGTSNPGAQPLALSTQAEFGVGGGQVRLTCSVPGGGGQVLTARWIKIMAMQVGKLTWVNLDSGVAMTVGSGKPAVTIGARVGPVAVPGQTWTTVGKLWLGVGSWWVRASLTFLEPWGYGGCQLKIGKKTSDSVAFRPGVASVVAVLDAAAHLSGGRWVKVACRGVAQGGESVSDVRLTAVKLGKVITDIDGSHHSYGSGKPAATFIGNTASTSLNTNPQWSTLASLDAGVGSWMFIAKTDLTSDVPVACQLTASYDFDITQTTTWADVTAPLAVVHSFGGPGSAVVQCNRQANGASSAAATRLAGFKLGTLQNVQLN